MKLFDLRADFENFCTFSFVDRSWSGDDWFEGTPRGDACAPLLGVRSGDGRQRPLPDFTDFGLRPIPTFSEHAVDRLGSLLRPHGEFVAIEMDEPVRYFAFNATTIVEVLDEEKSQIARFASSGRIWKVERHVLRRPTVALPPIFKIPQTRVGQTYVSEELSDAVHRHRLSGFRFDLLHDSQE